MARMKNKWFRGDRLKRIREKKGLTQANLEERLGLDPTRIYRYETGRSEPTS